MSAADKRMFNLGCMFMVGLGLLGQALHWFITPMAHPDASQARVAAVGAQALVGLIIAVVAFVRAKKGSAARDARVTA